MTLIFSKHTHKYFDYLVSAYRYQCVGSSEDCVRYENDDVFVNVRFDNGWSYELDVEVGQKGVLFNGQERPFNLGEILRLRGVEKKEKYTFVQTSNQEYLINAIEHLAELLKRYAKDFLQGDQAAFLSITSLRERECEDYEIEQELKSVRNEVAKAWDKKDFEKIIQLYTPVERYITPSEMKKLEYAKNHVD